jgi:hypothetical protein
MRPNEIYQYQITVEGYAPLELRVMQLNRNTDVGQNEPITYLFQAVLSPELFIRFDGAYAFILTPSENGVPVYKKYGNIPNDFILGAWGQISARLDNPDLIRVIE